MILRFGDTTQGLPSDKTMVSKQNSIKKKNNLIIPTKKNY